MKFLSGLWLFFLTLSYSTLLFAQSPQLGQDALPTLSQQSQHAAAASRISKIYTRSHYRSIPFDDELSSEIFDKFIQQLDGNRSLFLEEDLKRFEHYRYSLDQDIPNGRLEPLYSMFDLSLKRRYQQLVFSLQQLDEPMDFTKDEEFQYDRREANWPKTQAEIKELWRLKVKFDALNLKLAGREDDKIIEVLTKRYNSAIKRLVQTDSEDVFQTAMNAYSRSIEPHTSYLSPRNAERFQMEMNLSLEGIGAVLQGEDEYTVIRSLLPGGPAALSNQLGPEDKIVGVAQGKEELVDIIGWRLDDVVDLIKGPKGTTVRLEILSSGGKVDGKTKIVDIVRDKVRLEDRAAKSEVIEINGKKVGVLNVPSFYVNLSQDADVELRKLDEQNISSLIVDLRGNGGGALTEATALTGLFIPSGPVVQVRDQLGRISVNPDNSNSVSYSGPMVILVDRYSASASEIFAAALQDYGRAIVIGEQTYGKGTVQQHHKLSRLYDMYENETGYVQYTIAKFYRINGGSTQHKGVVPDISYPSALLPEETGESVEDNALPWDKIKPAKYSLLGDVKPFVEPLEKMHQQRIATDTEFQYIVTDIADYQKEKDRVSVSLNEQARIAIRDKKEQKLLTRLNERLSMLGMEPVKDLDDAPKDLEFEDAFLTEAAAIAVDYLELRNPS
ncbi:carboxy terminal-processing peptidase [Agarivorans sp. MS3-6]|uniref:carboxy terminal-processing peptidase n=1 Tax=Agarivorans sp. TSD2052 TaxID=2937286 RepID=UPI00200BC7B9|nr:carboxy terminal-processing peptidase [Agarivorans sp. TSD2052]UPW20585.1 carboxy terminal-processing peptidase [Agarivorans sp. TSD2052]